jgi:hypothetical protein
MSRRARCYPLGCQPQLPACGSSVWHGRPGAASVVVAQPGLASTITPAISRYMPRWGPTANMLEHVLFYAVVATVSTVHVRAPNMRAAQSTHVASPSHPFFRRGESAQLAMPPCESARANSGPTCRHVVRKAVLTDRLGRSARLLLPGSTVNWVVGRPLQALVIAISRHSRRRHSCTLLAKLPPPRL